MSNIPLLCVCRLCVVYIHDGVYACICNCVGVGFLLKQNEDVGVIIVILIFILNN